MILSEVEKYLTFATDIDGHADIKRDLLIFICGKDSQDFSYNQSPHIFSLILFYGEKHLHFEEWLLSPTEDEGRGSALQRH